MHCERKTIEGQSTIQDNTVTSSNEEYGYRFGLTEELKQFIVFPKPMFHMLVFKKNLFHNMGIYPFIALTSEYESEYSSPSRFWRSAFYVRFTPVNSGCND